MSLGWFNEYGPDPELIGHAMWQLDQPSLNPNGLVGEDPVSQSPQEIDKLVASLGEDFYGLMKISLLSIGLATLWQSNALKEPLDNAPFFWLHPAGASINLAMASDRLRDFLLVACTRSSPKSYGKSGKRNHLYVTPFRHAEGLLIANGFPSFRCTKSIQILPALGEHLYAYVRRRNQIVHEVATDLGKRKRTWHKFTELQERHDWEKESGFSRPNLWELPILAEDEPACEHVESTDSASDEVQA